MVRYIDLIKDALDTREEFSHRDIAPPLKTEVKTVEKKDENDREVYLAVRDYLEEVRKKVHEGRPFDIEPAVSLLRGLVDSPELMTKIYQFTGDYGHDDDFIISHSMNTMIYALKVGRGMGYEKNRLFELGLAALFHDVGMFRVPGEIINKPESLTEAESDLVRKHPEFGRDILAAWQEEYPFLPQVVHEHQERENGSGYPRGLQGDRMTEYAKIIGIVDTYEAMTHDRPHRRAISVRELIESRSKQFSPRIIKVFLEQISLYPIGSFVRLNNKAIGKVIATNDQQPLSPVLKLLYDSTGQKVMEERVLDLRANRLLWIVGNVPEEEMPGR